MKPVKAILFDKDGVFVDFEKTWTPVLKIIAADLGEGRDNCVAGQLLELAGFDPESDRFLPGSVWAAGHADDLVAVWLPMLAGMDRHELYERVELRCVEALPQPVLAAHVQRQIFSDLKAMGLRLGVATNDMAASARATVDRFGLADVFDLVLGYDSVPNPKPAGDPVMVFAEHCNVLPGEVMMVGDNTHDMHCGRAGGAGVVVGVLSGNSSRSQLEPLADHIIDDISHLPRLAARLLEHGAKVDG
jgi:phosphoglycolate phosphatase